MAIFRKVRDSMEILSAFRGRGADRTVGGVLELAELISVLELANYGALFMIL